MDWEQLREKTLGEVGTVLATEGIGVAGGFIGAAFIGRQVENFLVKTPVTATSSLTDKIIAWGANNIPKLALWWLSKDYAIEPGEVVTPMKEVLADGRKALAGSIAFDTILRLANSGVNPAKAELWGWEVLKDDKELSSSQKSDVQRLIKENSALRAELNKALQKLAAPPQQAQLAQPARSTQTAAPAQPAQQVQPAQPQVKVSATPVQPAQPQVKVSATPVQQAQQTQTSQPQVKVQATPAPVVRYQPAQQQAGVQTAQAQPAAPVKTAQQPGPVPYPGYAPAPPQKVPAPIPYPGYEAPPVSQVPERQRQFGFMQWETTPPAVRQRQKQFGFMDTGSEKDVAAMFGML
jgi:hypothetical protein